MIVAHIGGIPIEETLGFLGPFLVAAGAASQRLRAFLRHLGGADAQQHSGDFMPEEGLEPPTRGS